ncbi:MAG: Iron-binding protein IscA [Holosporales bacterium]
MDPIIVTPKALERIRYLIAARGAATYGIRITLKTKGCSGLAYAIEYADEKNPFDEELVFDQTRLLIDPKAIMYILGTEMDYQETPIQSGFVFVNPNEKGRCGCGKSFHV